MELAAVLFPFLTPGILDQNPPHRLSRGGKKMPAGVEGGSRGSGVGSRRARGNLLLDSRRLTPDSRPRYQPQIRFMHQRRRLQRMARLLVGELGRGELSQLVIDEW